MKITILGGGGFIGGNLIPYLKEKGHWVRAVDKNFVGYREELYKQADELLELDLLDYNNAVTAVAGCDWVIQLAADMGGVGYFHDKGKEYQPYIDNATINFNVLRACEMLNVQRLFFAASACIYPTHLNDIPDSPPLTEDMIYPANCDMSYGWEKLMMLRLCERAPFDARVGIFDTIYGPYQEKSGERMKFPTAIATKALASQKSGAPIEIWGDGTQKRVFLYIDDAMDKIYNILSDGYHGATNVCSTELVTVQEIAQLCCDTLGIDPGFTYKLDAPVGVMGRKSDNTKYEKYYGESDLVSTKEGFGKLLLWLKQN